MAERRVDPEDGVAYTYDEIVAHYKGTYKKKVIEEYWESCKPAKSKRGKSNKSKEETAPEAKEKKLKEKANTGESKATRRKPAAAEDVLKRVEACKVIPVIKLEDASHAEPLCKALKDGGIDVAEITFRTECAAEAMAAACKALGADICVGAGTVLRPEQVDTALEAGADFIVSPGFSVPVLQRCRRRGVLYLPGVVTPTEAMLANGKYGMKALKFFPASNYGGAGTLKSFGAVFPDISFMPTGGITEANIADFVSLPNVFAAGGSWMVSDASVKKAVESGEWGPITEAARSASAAAKAGATK